MNKLLPKILLLAEHSSDAGVIYNLLTDPEAGYEFVTLTDKEDFLQSLANQDSDVVLADFAMLQGDLDQTFKILNDLHFDPALILTGETVSEEVVVNILQKGADDYILKTNLKRLPSAIKKALQKRSFIEEKVKAEKALRLSELNYRTLFEQAADGIFIFDLEGKISNVNNNGCELSGYSCEELLNLNIKELFWEDDLKQAPLEFNNLQLGKSVLNLRNLKRKEGATLILETNTKMLPDGRFQCFMRDITERSKNEDALRITQHQLSAEHTLIRTLIDNLPDFIYATDTNHRFLLNNIANVKLMGAQTEKETLGKTIQDYQCHRFGQHNIENDKNVLTNGELIVNEEKIISRDDEQKRWLLTTKVPLKNSDGNIAGMVSISRDITEYKKAEEAIRKSEERYWQLVETSQVGIAIVDDQNTVTFANAHLAYMLGYTVPELVGRDVFDFITDEYKELALGNQKLRKAGITGKSDYKLKSKNGSILWVGMETSPVKTNGNYAGSLVIVIDITESKKAEEFIKISNKRFEVIAKASNDGIWEFDFTTGGIWWNEPMVEMFGISSSQELSISLMSNTIHPDEKEKVMANFHNAISGGKELWSMEFRMQFADGGYRPVFSRGYITYDKNRKPLKITGGLMDITERKKAEENLENMNTQLRELSSHLQNVREEERASMAREIHDELGQQLTCLKMDLSWLNKHLTNENKMISSRCTRSLAMIDDTIATVRKIAADLRPGILDDFGLPEALFWQSKEFEKRYEGTVRFHCNNDQLQLSSQVNTGLFRIYQESLTNIARHAEAKNIYCVLEAGAEKLSMIIQDDGKGFDLNQLSRKKTFGILGMKERAFMMGGNLQMQSEPGKGTTVLITVPMERHNQHAIT